ncbi:homogentisate 1,2-dioxygenase [Cryptosporangium phraense]|uniref:Homogentisate 1,2-dioxygenase n=1 Tax=Cryptosporangium phraense TaxID=2593070 RepID=A0A545ATJ5_9ACTN|nr:homogentisate 1,2-dioxygenase [Cryptosporangium phraense]TQS44659.1 homogentisate 1,2-dioxygenase [Cryptosporangium phraense]
MESFVQLRRGTTPRRIHADLDGLKDDELGRGGFTGRTAHLYRRHDPTAFRAEGPLAGTDVQVATLTPGDATDPAGTPLLLFSNPDCRLSLSRRTAPHPFYVRTVDGDELYFVHQGDGTFVTEFGDLAYRPGDFVYLPKATTYRQVPRTATTALVIETVDELRPPPAGALGRHFPFDSALAVIPEARAIDDDGRDEYEVRLYHSGDHTSLFYRHDPCDAEGWRGDNFPFTFHVDDYTPVLSDAVHLPPTVHLFLQATGVDVLNFLPRPAETVPGTERLPWYHRNADHDEIAFFHGGTLFGADLPAGLLTHAPQGVHHGAPEVAREHARRHFADHDRVNWTIIAVDTRRRLTPGPALR